jgi:hypothetical protein
VPIVIVIHAWIKANYPIYVKVGAFLSGYVSFLDVSIPFVCERMVLKIKYENIADSSIHITTQASLL